MLVRSLGKPAEWPPRGCANAVISRLDYFFSHHGFGERDVYNCTGQNKNNCMMQYLVWRTITNRHTNITLSFLPVGHTEFAPDWCFRLFKRSYRRTKVGGLPAIAQVVNSSADYFSQLVVREDGSTLITTYNWADFFALRMKKTCGIKKFHHFYVLSSSPGLVFTKRWSDSPEVTFKLLKEPWTPAPWTHGCRRVASSCTTTWAKHGMSVVLVWLYSPVLLRQWQGHCLPTPSVPNLPPAGRALQSWNQMTQLLHHLNGASGHVGYAIRKVMNVDHVLEFCLH